jgi:transcriptional regulator
MGKAEKLQGALDLLILRTLRRGPLHGYGIVCRIQQTSEGALEVEEGSLYPALHRIEREGWVTAEWKVTERNRRAKFYRLTPAGRKQLEREVESWNRLSSAVGHVLRNA